MSWNSKRALVSELQISPMEMALQRYQDSGKRGADAAACAALLEIVETSNHRFRQRALQRMATRAEANLKMMRSVENVERELIRLETIRREPKGEFLTDVQEFQTAINEVTAEAIVLNETIHAVEAAEAPSGRESPQMLTR